MGDPEVNWLVATLRWLLNLSRLICLLDSLANIACKARDLFVSFNVLKACFLNSRNAPVIFVFSWGNLLLLGWRDDNRGLMICFGRRLSSGLWTDLRLALASVSKKSKGTAQQASALLFLLTWRLTKRLRCFDLSLFLSNRLLLDWSRLLRLGRSNFWKRIVLLIISLCLVHFGCIERFKGLCRLDGHT